MKHELVYTENYVLVLYKTFITNRPRNSNVYALRCLEVVQFGEVENCYLYECIDIKAHLPLNNSPVLEDVDLLPPLNEPIDFAEMFYGILKATHPEFDDWVEAIEYKKHKATTKVYSEGDVEKKTNRKVCKCKRAYENPLSEICSLCWNELYPDEKDEVKEDDLIENTK